MCPLAGTWMDRASVCVKEVRGKKEGGKEGRGRRGGRVKEVRGEGRRGQLKAYLEEPYPQWFQRSLVQ